MPTDHPKPHNDYIMDAESGAETARLLIQERLMTQAMGGIFGEGTDHLAHVSAILDIGTGPGGWARDVAYAYPQIKVVGIDISNTMVQYANAHAKAQHIEDNAFFQVMDATKPLEFPDESFDLVNARFIIGFMPTSGWPMFLQECRRIIRPGGFIRLTEGDTNASTSIAYDQLLTMMSLLLKKAGKSFSHDGRSGGIVPKMGPLLRQAGFQHIQKMAHVIESSPSLDGYGAWFDNIKVTFQSVMPVLVKMGITTQEEFEQVYDAAIIDMLSDDFCAISYYVTMWGTKP